MHVYRNYVRRGAVDPKKFFKVADITKYVSGLSREIVAQLEDMFATIRRKQEPDIRIGKPHIDRPAIAAFLSQLKYPLSYLDFETFGTAIPLFDGSSRMPCPPAP